MWNDNDTNIDLIDFQHLVGSVTKIISNDSLLPCTIGLYGDWGSGKSSLMRMVEASVEEDNDILTIKFNGWLFEGYEDAKSVLMGTIIDELINNKTLTSKAKGIIARLLKRVDWMKLAWTGIKAGVGYAAMGPEGMLATSSDISMSSAVKSLDEIDYGKYIDDAQSNEEGGKKYLRAGIKEFHKDFGDLLKETGVKKLVVFIDDLDRCNPSTIIETLEAIKLFLFVENSAFVISADERLIEYAVKRRFPEIPGGSQVGRDYLEKLIQFPLRIPSLSQSELETYINLLFTKLHIVDESEFDRIRISALDHKAGTLFSARYNSATAVDVVGELTTDELKNDLLLSTQITPILANGLNGNPRQTKRFLNTLLLRLYMGESKGIELSKRKLAKLMLIEYFKPEFFRKLSEMPFNQEGFIEEFIQIETGLKEKDGDGEKNGQQRQKICFFVMVGR